MRENSVFGKTMENIGKLRDIKFVAIYTTRRYSVSESNYHATKQFSKNLLKTEMNKTNVKKNRPVHLDLLILNIGMS